MKKIVGLGACTLDTVITCEEFPAEDTKRRAKSVTVCGGGPVGNALAAAARLGAEAEYIGMFPDGGDGEFLKNELNEYGVNTANAVWAEDARAFSSYVILAESGGTRTCVFDRGTIPDDAEKLNLAAIDTADVLHLDGNYLYCALTAARYARGRGIKVSLDAGGLYEGIKNLLPYADFLIPSEEFALKFTGLPDAESAAKELSKRFSPEVLVITQGVKGGVFVSGDEIGRYGSFDVRCADSNGAGDVFHGAFLAAYLGGNSVVKSCEFASAAAALKCVSVGVKKSLPDYVSVVDFIKKTNNKVNTNFITGGKS